MARVPLTPRPAELPSLQFARPSLSRISSSPLLAPRYRSLTSPVYVSLTLLASPKMEVKNIPSNGFIEQSRLLPLFSFYLADGECFLLRGKTLC